MKIDIKLNPKPIKMETGPGQNIYKTIEDAIELSKQNDRAYVWFVFNDRHYAVDDKTDPSLFVLNIHLNDPSWRDAVCWESRTR